MAHRSINHRVLVMMALAGLIAGLVVAVPPTIGASVASAATPTPQAGQAAHDVVVSDEPVAWTPQVKDGRILAIAQVGNTMVVGGSFANVSPANGSPVSSRSNVFAFNATNGSIINGFNPAVQGGVEALLPGPQPGTVFVAGSFSGIGGASGKLFLLRTSDGSIVQSFQAPGFNGKITDLALVGDRLLVGGAFTASGGQSRGGLLSLNASTGALDNYLQVALTENHNWDGDGARAAIGVRAMSVNPENTQLAVIGNFKRADGLLRDQFVLIDLTDESAQVREDWRTRRYEPACFSNAFDTYVRGVEWSPDGEYAVVTTTGGPNPGTLCDTVSAWDAEATGDDVQPIWVDDTGGDTLWGVAATGAAVYVGGHQRWMNNAGGRDRPVAGSVPRPGLGAVDPRAGVPLSWNPGRQPRGVAAFALYATPQGLWMGTDTNYVGDFEYWRPRLAFFPTAGGVAPGAGQTGSLPSNVYIGGTPAPTVTTDEVILRVNAGGPVIPATDGGPDWSADAASSSPLRNSGSNASGWPSGATTDGSVPRNTPTVVFDSERWDPSGDPELQWDLEVPEGTEIDVRLFFANRYGGTSSPGQRVFDVTLDGDLVLDDLDLSASPGHEVGTMKEFSIVSDGVVDIDLGHVVENPLINAIEIVRSSSEPEPEEPAASFGRRYLAESGGVSAYETRPDGGIDWNAVRGAVLVDDQLYFGVSDGTWHRRSFDGENFGTDELVDPSNDPDWADVNTGSGQTYRGVRSTFYGEIPSVAGLAYGDGSLYYSMVGSAQIYARDFSPESGIMASERREMGAPFASPGSLFLSGSHMFSVDRASGTLQRVEWSPEGAVGPVVDVSGPAIDGSNWGSSALFLGPGPAAPVDGPPVAEFSSVCDGLVCEFDGSGSSDDGSVVEFVWDFGDGSSDSGAVVGHEFSAGGSYDVTLTVTDDSGKSGSVTEPVVIDSNVAPVAEFTAVCDGLVCEFDGSGSSDDGSVVEFVWDFGDGSGDSGAVVGHEFSAGGSYDVTLTVTDDGGKSGSVTEPVTADGPPVAEFAAVCDGLVCEFDGSGSSDDGSVVEFVWDFGDGSGDSGAVVGHEFSAGGSYDVTLTVTDDSGKSGSVTRPVVVDAALVDAMSFVDAQQAPTSGAVRSTSVEVPSTTKTGDLVLLFTANNTVAQSLSEPGGGGSWTLADVSVEGSMESRAYWQIAGPSTAGATVSFTQPDFSKVDLNVLVYRGVDVTDPVQLIQSAGQSRTTLHASPEVDVVGDGRWLVSAWFTKSSTVTGQTAPQIVEARLENVGSGGGRLTGLLGDVAGAVEAGPQGGLELTTDAAVGRSISYSIVINPGSAIASP